MHNLTIKRILSISIFFILLSAFTTSFADNVEVKSIVSVPYNSSWLSSKPDDKSNQQALNAAKLEIWKTYTSKFNDAKMQSYLTMADKFKANIDNYVQNVVIVDKDIDKNAKTIQLVVRAQINETAVDAAFAKTSQAANQGTGKGNAFVFLFMTRSGTSIKSYDNKKIVVKKNEKFNARQDKDVQTDNEEGQSSTSVDMEKSTTGGSVERKQSKVTYDVASSQDIDSAMGNILSTAGFEVISYDDVVANCGGIDKTQIAKEFAISDDLSTEARKSAVNASRDCEVSIFATGTLDIGVQDTDPVTGNKRVIVSVRGQVWNIDSKLPRKIASVGPVQFSGLGPDDSVASRNALNLAAKEAAKIIVDQLNLKGVH